MGTRSSGWLLEPRVPGSAWIPGDSGNPEIRVTRSSRWHRVPEFSVSSGKQSSGRLREYGVPVDSGNLKFRVTPRNRTKPRIQGDSGNPEFRVNPVIPKYGWLRERGVPGDSLKWEFRLTTGTETELGDRGESGNPEFRMTVGTLSPVSGDFENQDFRVNLGKWISSWIRGPRVPGDSLN